MRLWSSLIISRVETRQLISGIDVSSSIINPVAATALFIRRHSGESSKYMCSFREKGIGWTLATLTLLSTYDLLSIPCLAPDNSHCHIVCPLKRGREREREKDHSFM